MESEKSINEFETTCDYSDTRYKTTPQIGLSSSERDTIDLQDLKNESQLRNIDGTCFKKTDCASEWLFSEISSLEIVSVKWMKPKDYFESIVQKGYRLNREFKNGDSIIELSQLEKLQKELKGYVKGLLFVFKIRTSTKEWNIVKNYQEFENLHKQYKSQNVQNLPPFVKNSDNLLKNLEDWLLKLRKNNDISMKYGLFHEFQELTKIHSFTDVKIFKQGYVNKRQAGNYKESLTSYWCKAVCSRWQKRWTAVTEEGICYIYRPDDDLNGVGDMLLFDKTIRISFGRINTGKKNGCMVYTTTKKFLYETTTRKEFYEFLNALFDAIAISAYVKPHRFDASYPIREENQCKAYINGEKYFSDLYDIFNSAKSEIFIRAWWLCPEIYLKRPIEENQYSRLDRVQLSAADKGVKIYIIVYQEFETGMNNDSSYVVRYINSLHENIHILRHPPATLVRQMTSAVNFFQWSHHEKSIVIDQEIAFLGGMDQAYGKYETANYDLFEPKKGVTYYPGADYSNPTIKEALNVRDYEKCMIDKKKQPRMPWRDVHLMVKGPIVHDLSRSFSQYWSFVKNESVSLKKNHFVFLKKKFADASDKFKKYMKKRDQDRSEYISMMEEVPRKISKSLPLKDILSSPIRTVKKKLGGIKKKFFETIDEEPKLDLEEKFKDTPLRTKQFDFKKSDAPELVEDSVYSKEFSENLTINDGSNEDDKDSWEKNLKLRDIIMPSFSGTTKEEPIVMFKTPKKRKVSIDIISDKQKDQKLKIDLKNEKFDLEEDLDNDFNLSKSPIRMLGKIVNMARGTDNNETDVPTLNFNNIKHSVDSNMPGMNCQILRSAGQWSLGLHNDMTEQSIHLAYIDLIKNAKNFIYIENQFFIGSYANDNMIQNQVASTIFNRIKEAINNDEKFKVIVVLPQKAGFQGEYDSTTIGGYQVREQLYWHQLTINKGKKSLLGRISELTSNPKDYIQFIGLRNHQISPEGVPTTEQVYVHSKIMLVDDRIAIIGSANINDRSMNGNRDSELCMVIEDTTKVESVMNGKKYSANEFCYNLRVKAMCSIFDCPADKVIDPLDQNMWNWQNTQMTVNVRIYREIFCCLPDSNMTKYSDCSLLPKKSDITKYEEMSKGIKGYAVHYAHRFLKDEDLKSDFMNDFAYFVVDPNWVT